MKLLHNRSLAATVDAVNEALFTRQRLSESDRSATAKWIAARQGLPGSYANMFAPTDTDFRDGIRVFTGERIATRAGVAHILGEEACRVLILLRSTDTAVRAALKKASAGILERLSQSPTPAARSFRFGAYCCGICTCSLWRHLAAGGLGDAQPGRRLGCGMKILKEHRLGNGRWQRFPFFYTLLALTEMPPAIARAELRYAAPVCERLARQPMQRDRRAERRRLVAVRALETI